MKKLYTLLIGAALSANVAAQSPDKMSYQAVVRDAGNALVTNQSVGMQISILQGSASGPSVYTETQTPSTNINGLVSLEIGSGTVVSGAFNSIDWNNGPYFIQTETDPSGGTNYTITGTSQLMSVPYALHASTADSLVGAITVTAADTAAWNNHTVDTQIDSTGIAAFGYVAGPHTIDTDTHIDSTGIAALGYVAGPHTIDTDTHIDSLGIAAYGFVAGPHFDGDFTSLTNVPAGLADGDDDTQLTEAQVDAYANNNGYLTSEVDGSVTNEIQTLSISGNDLTLSNGGGTVTLPGGGSGGGDEIVDADVDTRVQVEETNDDDIIRFDVEGVERWRMDGHALEEANTFENICIGIDAGDALLPGATDNILIGSLTGTNVTTGDFNTVIGSETFDVCTTGDFNTIYGYQAAHNLTTANLNTAMGAFALYDITTGQDNVAYGRGALSNVTTGTHNLGIGRDAGLRVNVGSNNIFIGNNAGANTAVNISDKLYIDNTNTNTPLIYGDFFTDELTINGAMFVDGNLVPEVTNAHSLGATTARWTEVHATNGVIQTSDVRLKKNIKPLNYGLETVLAMRAVSYNWKDRNQAGDKIGFIAQELEKLVPEVVTIGTDENKTRGVNYSELVPVLVRAIQDLEAKNRELTEQNEAHELKYAELNNKLDEVLEMLSTSAKK